MSSHQALGESDSRIVSRYRVTSKVPLQKGLKCVYLDLYLLALFFFFFILLFIFILFSASAPYHLFSSVASSEASRLQQSEGPSSGGTGTNNLLAAQGLKERKNEIRNW